MSNHRCQGCRSWETLLYCDHLSLTIQATKASFAFGSGLFLLANVLPKLSWSLNLCLHPDLWLPSFTTLSWSSLPGLPSPHSLWWRRQWHPTPVLLPGKSHGWRSLVGFSPWGRDESDTTERLHFYFSLSCIGEGNGNPLQCSCLENPRDSRAWWAAVCGVTQSRTWLRRLSSNIHSEPTDFFVCASATPAPTAWFLQLQPTPGIAHYCYLGDLM